MASPFTKSKILKNTFWLRLCESYRRFFSWFPISLLIRYHSSILFGNPCKIASSNIRHYSSLLSVPFLILFVPPTKTNISPFMIWESSWTWWWCPKYTPSFFAPSSVWNISEVFVWLFCKSHSSIIVTVSSWIYFIGRDLVS